MMFMLCVIWRNSSVYLDVTRDKVIVFAANLCLEVLLLLLLYYPTGTGENVCVNSFILLAKITASWWPDFLVRHLTLLL